MKSSQSDSLTAHMENPDPPWPTAIHDEQMTVLCAHIISYYPRSAITMKWITLLKCKTFE